MPAKRLRRGDRLGLAIDAGRHVADLGRAVVVDREAADDGENIVAIAHRFVRAFQHDEADAVTEDRSARCDIEGPAASIAGDETSFFVLVAAPLREGNRDATGEREIALVGEQVLARLRNSDERSGASALHGDEPVRAGSIYRQCGWRRNPCHCRAWRDARPFAETKGTRSGIRDWTRDCAADTCSGCTRRRRQCCRRSARYRCPHAPAPATPFRAGGDAADRCIRPRAG